MYRVPKVKWPPKERMLSEQRIQSLDPNAMVDKAKLSDPEQFDIIGGVVTIGTATQNFVSEASLNPISNRAFTDPNWTMRNAGPDTPKKLSSARSYATKRKI